ncbi:heterokaryon incompatibility protein-domain-containing protein [Fomes fomentarius]|nr:heterokaryon incompatibility protein-domain-containing protein [Fomes fomentarius]
MWLLRTHRAELKYFVSPPTYNKGYAILSHVWGENEQTFQDIQAISARCAIFGINPRRFVSKKIRDACTLAERFRYQWLWIDTCCIDKTSSTELSEAINSMFRYYSEASVSFAYLEDVSRDRGGESVPEDQFLNSRWHTRGWTLQELIAPKELLFVSKSWEIIGEKAPTHLFSGLVSPSLVEKATRIPVKVLRGEVALTDFSIAQRMSWAAGRKTTREEDEAYCLVGIFDINMPTLYGEGRKAFRRLQEEIMRQNPDTTVLAWGLRCTWRELDEVPLDRLANDSELVKHTLFAESPSSFLGCSDISFRPWDVPEPRWSQRLQDVFDQCYQTSGSITFTSAAYGASTELPMMMITGKQQHFRLAHLGWVAGGGYLLLLLHPLPRGYGPKDTYGVGLPGPLVMFPGQPLYPRIVSIPFDFHDSTIGPQAIRLEWRKITLAYYATRPDVIGIRTIPIVQPDSGTSSPSPGRNPDLELSSKFYSPFHYYARVEECEGEAHDSCFHFMESESSELRVLPSTTHTIRFPSLPSSWASELPSLPWTGDTPAWLLFSTRADLGPYQQAFIVTLGVCTTCTLSSSEENTVGGAEQRRHWACVQLPWSSVDKGSADPHSCLTDHILEWPNRTRKFGITIRRTGALRLHEITLSFIPYMLDPDRTLVMRVVSRVVETYDSDCREVEYEL